MKIKCVAVDDEPLALKQIANYIERTSSLELVGTANSAVQTYEILEKYEVDLLFIDINMPLLNGLDFVKSLAQKPGIIFTTAYSEYAVEGFKVDAIDYLLKPIGYDSFMAAVAKARQRLKLHDTEDSLEQKLGHLFIKSEYKIIRLNIDDIKYIEGQREYVRIYPLNQKPIMTLLSFKKLLEKLPEDKFMRVHRSYIVNLSKITIIERNRIIFDEDVRIPISEQYKEAFQKYLDENFLK